MHVRAGHLFTVFLAAVVITASGPAVAYHSSQALPGVTADPTKDDGNTVIQTSDIDSLDIEPNPRLSFLATLGNDDNKTETGTEKENGNTKDRAGKQENNGRGQDESAGKKEKDRGDKGNNSGNKSKGKGNGNGTDNGEGTRKGENSGNPGDKAANNGKGKDRGNGKDKNTGTKNGEGPNTGSCASGNGDTTNETATKSHPKGNACDGPGLTVDGGDIELGPNATALDHRHAAQLLLEAADASGPGNSGQAFDRKRQRALRHLNTTFKHHLDADRASSAALFNTDHQTIAPLATDLPNVTKHLVTSDRLLAEQAITDAETVQGTLAAKNISYDESEVSYHLQEARRAYEQGRQNTGAPHASIEHYREAWTHAQRAIDLMDEAVAPDVTVAQRADLPHNGTRNVSVSGSVFDVRGYELTATVAINNTTRNLTLATGTAPLVNTTFNTTVTLRRQWPLYQNGTLTENATTRAYLVNVSVRDPGVDVANQGYDTKEDRHHPQQGSASLAFDGDGLPGWYERTVTGTNPLDPDSDYRSTHTNESNNGVIDSLEDTDSDGVIAFYEYNLGTDPLNPDTDGDNLSDGFEEQYGFDPLSKDSDNDNVTDGREDPDGDQLPNAREEEIGTSPIRNDTDADGLDDGAELRVYGTDPTSPDTDDDGLSDGAELSLPTNATVPDTDGDGVLDGDERFTTKRTHTSSGVTIAATGTGAAAERVQIEQTAPMPGPATGNVTRVSPTVRLSAGDTVDSVTVRIPLSEAATQQLEQARNQRSDNGSLSRVKQSVGPSLKMYRWRPGRNESWQPIKTTIENGTAIAEVSSMGYFTVRDPSEWRNAQSAESAANLTTIVAPDGEPVDTLAITNPGPGGDCPTTDDVSGKRIIDSPTPTDTYAPPDTPACPTATPPDDDSGESTPTTPPGTSPIDGPSDNVTIRVPQAASVWLHADIARTIDGQDSYSLTINESGGPVRDYSVSQSSGKVEISQFAGEVVTINYSSMEPDLQRMFITRDSDGDGFPDSVEAATQEQRVRLPRGSAENAYFELSPTAKDSDGDGLTDQQEVDLTWEYIGTNVIVQVTGGVSNPAVVDTDSEGVSDYGELKAYGTRAFSIDSDDDGFNDLVDERPTTPDLLPTVKITSPRLTPIYSRTGTEIVGWRQDELADTTEPLVQRSDYYEHVRITISSSSRVENVEVNALYTPELGSLKDSYLPGDSSFWDDSHVVYEQFSPSWMSESRYGGVYDVFLSQHGAFDEPPTAYWVNVTTDGGMGYRQKIQLPEPGIFPDSQTTVESYRTVPAIAGVAASTEAVTGGSLAGVSVVGAGAAAVGGVVIGAAGYTVFYTANNRPVSSFESDTTLTTMETGVPATTFVKDWTAGETGEELGPVRLPAGQVYEAPAEFPPASDRGFGRESVLQLPGATPDNVEGGIGEVLRAPSAVTQDGPYKIVIGDNPFGEGNIRFRLLATEDGLIVVGAAANPVISEYDPEFGQHNERRRGDDTVLRRQQFNHIRNDHPDIPLRDIRAVIENPDEVYVAQTPQGQDWYMWAAEINGRWVVVKGTVVGGEVRIGTAFAPRGYAYITNWANKKGANQIYPI